MHKNLRSAYFAKDVVKCLKEITYLAQIIDIEVSGNLVLNKKTKKVKVKTRHLGDSTQVKASLGEHEFHTHALPEFQYPPSVHDISAILKGGKHVGYVVTQNIAFRIDPKNQLFKRKIIKESFFLDQMLHGDISNWYYYRLTEMLCYYVLYGRGTVTPKIYTQSMLKFYHLVMDVIIFPPKR